jgi:hypothetical protein
MTNGENLSLNITISLQAALVADTLQMGLTEFLNTGDVNKE